MDSLHADSLNVEIDGKPYQLSAILSSVKDVDYAYILDISLEALQKAASAHAEAHFLLEVYKQMQSAAKNELLMLGGVKNAFAFTADSPATPDEQRALLGKALQDFPESAKRAMQASQQSKELPINYPDVVLDAGEINVQASARRPYSLDTPFSRN